MAPGDMVRLSAMEKHFSMRSRSHHTTLWTDGAVEVLLNGPSVAFPDERVFVVWKVARLRKGEAE